MAESSRHDQDLDGDATEARFEQIVDLDASIGDAWDAISDPDELANWLGSSVELDARPGGRGRVVEEDGTVRELVVTDVRHGKQIAWHWWSDGGELSSVELRLDEQDGHTRLHIVETTLLPAAQLECIDAQVGACSRRWSAATGRLWRHVGVAAFA